MTSSQKKLYLIGSLRNQRVPLLAKSLRTQLTDVEVFDDWFAAGPEADDYWKSYEQERGRTYGEALEGYAARHVFDFDRHHLDTSTHCLLVLPAGKSGHMEIMYAKYGVGARTAILLGEDVRWDVMYQFVDDVLTSSDEIPNWIAGSVSAGPPAGRRPLSNDEDPADRVYRSEQAGLLTGLGGKVCRPAQEQERSAGLGEGSPLHRLDAGATVRGGIASLIGPYGRDFVPARNDR